MLGYRLAAPLAALVCVACGGAPDLSDGDTLVLETQAISIAPGEESYVCQYFPPGKEARWIDEFFVPSTPGLHHLFVFRMPDDGRRGAEPGPCNGDVNAKSDGRFPAINGGSFTVPAGAAFALDAGEGLLFQMHLLNASAERLDARVVWKAHLVAADRVEAPAGIFFFSNTDIDLPPHADTTVTKTCTAPQSGSMFAANGHFHGHTIEYRASIAGQRVLDGTVGDSSRRFDPAFAIHAGDPITWSCDDRNTGVSDVVYGPSLQNEMCNFAAYLFPVEHSQTLRCQ
jgi:hypothetical protein